MLSVLFFRSIRLGMRTVLMACTMTMIVVVAAHTDISPEWISRLPVGSSLTAGIQGMVVDVTGVSFVTGITGPSSNTDVVTAAFASDGSLIWSSTFNGPQDWHDQARGITLGPGGVLYVTGNTPGSGLYANVLVLKYDAITGVLLNTIQYSSGPFTSEYGASIATDQEGNVYVGGGTVGDGSDALILKFDASGQFVWKRTWDGPAFAPYSQDHAREILIDPQGDPVVMIEGVMNSLHPDYVLVKYSADDGTTMWEMNWGVAGGDFPQDMEIDASGDIYVTGTGINFTDQFSTIKVDGSDGTLLWQEYDSAGLDDYAAAIFLDGQGGVFITGSADPDGDQSNFNDNIYTVKRDSMTGSLYWTHLYGENCVGCFDVPSDVIVDPAGKVFVAGSTSSPPYSGDMILLVLDTDSGVEIDRGIISGGANELAGSGTLDFDSSYNLFNGGEIGNYNTGDVDITVVKYSSLIGDLYRLTVTELIPGASATFAVENATPSKMQFILFGLEGLGSTPIPQLNVIIDLENPHLGQFGPADDTGFFQATVKVPFKAAGRTVWFQAVEQGQTTPVLSRIVQGTQ